MIATLTVLHFEDIQANVEEKNHNGETPIDVAYSKGYTELADLFKT